VGVERRKKGGAVAKGGRGRRRGAQWNRGLVVEEGRRRYKRQPRSERNIANVRKKDQASGKKAW